jgi:hypothetical protein
MQTGTGAQVVGFEDRARATLEADDNQIEDSEAAAGKYQENAANES